MSTPFLEENIFLPGSPEEQEEQKKTWEEILADDVAAQTAPVPPPPPPPPVGLTPGEPSDTLAPAPRPAPAPAEVGFTEEAGGQAFAPAAPPLPLDPMEQALGGLEQELGSIPFQEQNTQLSKYDPITGYSQDFVAEGIDTFATTYLDQELSPVVDEVNRLASFIEDWNDFGILPPEFDSPQQLQVAYDASVGQYDQVWDSRDAALTAEQDRLVNVVQGKLSTRQNVGQHRALTPEVNDALSFEPLPPGFDTIQIPNTTLSVQSAQQQAYQNEVTRLTDLRMQDPFFDSFMYDAEREAWNEEILRTFGRTADTDVLRYMIPDSFGTIGPDETARPYIYYDDQGRPRQTLSRDLALDRPGSFIRSAVAPAISAVTRAVPDVIEQTFLKPIAGGTARGISHAWNQLPGAAQENLKTAGEVAIELPDQIAANIYVAVKERDFRTLAEINPFFKAPSATVGLAVNPSREELDRALNVSPLIDFERDPENLERFNRELPFKVRIPVIVAASLFADPLNLVAPLKWGARAGDAYATARQRKVIGELISEASRSSVAADIQFTDGVSLMLKDGSTFQDITKGQFARSVLRDLKIIGRKADNGLTDEFEQRVTMRLYANDDANQTNQIILEELGRIADKGKTAGIKVDVNDRAVLEAANRISDSWADDGALFWSKAFPEGEQTAQQADAAWRQARDQIPRPGSFIGPVDRNNLGPSNLVRWGSGPEDVFNGRWYRRLKMHEQSAEEFDRQIYLMQSLGADFDTMPASNNMVDLVRGEFDRRGLIAEYRKPQTVGDATKMLDRIRRTGDIPLPPGMTAQDVLQDQRYIRLVDESYAQPRGTHATVPQLAGIEVRSRLAQRNLFDELAVDSPTATAFSRKRADEVIRRAPATESQKGLLRDLANVGIDGKRKKRIKRKLPDGTFDTTRDAPILKMTFDEIDQLTYSDAHQVLRAAISPEKMDEKAVYSLRDGNINATIGAHESQRVAAEMKSVLDDLLIKEGKEGLWTAWHTQRLDVPFAVKFFSDMIGGNGRAAHPLLNDPHYGPLVRKLGEMRNQTLTDDQFQEARRLLVGLVETADSAPLESTSQMMRFVIDMTERSVKTRRFRTAQPANFQRIPKQALNSPEQLEAAVRDVMMRRAVYTADAQQLQRYEGFMRTVGIDIADFDGLRAGGATDLVLRQGSDYARQAGADKFRRVTREFFGMQSFTPQRFVDEYHTLKTNTDKLAREMQQIERDLELAAERLGDTRAVSSSLRSSAVHDKTREFADQLRIRYTGPEAAYDLAPPPSRLPILNDRVRANTWRRIQAMDAARQDSTAEVARAHQIHAMRGDATDLPEQRIIVQPQPDPETGMWAEEVGSFYSDANNAKINDIITGRDTTPIVLKQAEQFGGFLRAKTARLASHVYGARNVTFATATDEAIWKVMRGELDDQTRKRLGEYMHTELGMSKATMGNVIERLDKAVTVVKGNLGEDTPILIQRGKIAINDPARDRLLRTVQGARDDTRGPIVDALEDIRFNIPSGSPAAREWAKVDGFDYWKRLRPNNQRPDAKVFNPYAAALNKINWQESGPTIDKALDYTYTKDPVWQPPGKRNVMAKLLGDQQKTQIISDDTHMFASTLVQHVAHGMNSVHADPYTMAREVLDQVARNDPVAMREFQHIFDNSEHGRRWLRWLRQTDADGVSNWNKLAQQWDRMTPHMGVAKMPMRVLDKVASTRALSDGHTVFNDLGKLDEFISDPRKAFGDEWDNLNQLEQDEMRAWADGMRSKWNKKVGQEGSTQIKPVREWFQNIDGSWKTENDFRDLDAKLFENDFLEPHDLDGFLDNIATRAGEIEARRIGFDPSEVPFGMAVQRAVKGNLGYFWLGTPRYLIMNIFGNIMSELLYMARTGGHGLTGIGIPKPVLQAWDEGAYLPRQLTTAFQSLATEDPLMANQIRLNAREGGPTIRQFRTIRQEERARGGAATFIPRQLERGRFNPGRLVTGWVDGIQFASENAEIWSRRRIYGRELWGSYQQEFRESLAALGNNVTPELNDRLLRELTPENVSRVLADTDPVLRKQIMRAHADSTATANLNARYWTEKAMRDYRMRNRADELLDKFSPYHFWTTKNLLFFSSTVADRPAVALHGMRAFDAMSEAWDEMPASFRGKLRLFTVPDQVPIFGGQEIWLRPDNITQPALFIAALTVGDIQQAWDRHEDMTLPQRLGHTFGDGVKSFGENLGFRFGPQWEYSTAVAQARVPDRLDPEIPLLHDQLFGDLLPGVAYPHGYRPDSFLPLAGMEHAVYGLTDDVILKNLEDMSGKDLGKLKWRRVNEYVNQFAYGDTFTRNDIVFLGIAPGVEMLRDGGFGEVTLDEDGNVTGYSDEAFRNFFGALIALNENDLDNPHVRQLLDRQYKDEQVRSLTSVAGAPITVYTEEWKESTEANQRYKEIRDEQGSSAAWAWAVGEYNRNTGMYESTPPVVEFKNGKITVVSEGTGNAPWLPFYWAANDDVDELRHALQFGETSTSGFGNVGMAARIRQNNATYWTNDRAENTKFQTKASPYFGELNQTGEFVDERINRELAKPIEERNMAYVDSVVKWGNRRRSDIYQRAEDDGVQLQRPRSVPKNSAAWWKMGSANPIFLEEGMTGGQISAARERDAAEAQTVFVLDMVVQQLDIELYDHETGQRKQQYMVFDTESGEWHYDPSLYEAAVAEAAETAPDVYQRMIRGFANDPDNPLLLGAQGGISSKLFMDHVNQNVIPELEEWQQGRSDHFDQVAELPDGPEKDAAIRQGKELYGEEFYRFGPNVKYIVDNIAGDVMGAFDELPLQGQQEFIERYPHLFDTRGNFRANMLGAEDVIEIATEYNVDIPRTVPDLQRLADSASVVNEVYRNVLSNRQKEKWRDSYGDPDSPLYIEGMFSREIFTDPETGEEIEYTRLNREALGPAELRLILHREGIDPQQWREDVGPLQAGGLTFQAQETSMVQTAVFEKKMDDSLGKFWSGEAYLNEDERDNLQIFRSFKDDHPDLEEAALALKERLGPEFDKGYATWEEALPFTFDDPALAKYIRDRIVISDETGQAEINEKENDFLRSAEGRELLDYFANNETLQDVADNIYEPPALREFKEGINDASLWADTQDEIDRWEAWNQFTGFESENADMESLARQYKKDLDVSWKDLPDLIADPQLKTYIEQRNALFDELEVVELWGKVGQYLTTSEGQAGYEMDPEAFEFYLGVFGDSGADDGGGTTGGTGGKGKGGKGSSYGTNYYGRSSRGGGNSSRRQTGFARTVIDDYADTTQQIFHMDTQMISGQAADSETRMGYAQRVADRIEQIVGLVSNPLFQGGTMELVAPFLSILLMNIQRRLGETPTVDSWLDVLRWLGLEEGDPLDLSAQPDEEEPATPAPTEEQGVIPLDTVQ